MKRVALITLLALGSCEFAQKHPAVTAGIAAGSVGFLGCETDGVDTKYCAIAGGAAGLGLGLIAGLVTLIFDTGDTQPIPEDEDEEVTPTGAIKVHTHTAPPPVALDAGVAPALDGGAAPAIAPDAAAALAAPADAAP